MNRLLLASLFALPCALAACHASEVELQNPNGLDDFAEDHEKSQMDAAAYRKAFGTLPEKMREANSHIGTRGLLGIPTKEDREEAVSILLASKELLGDSAELNWNAGSDWSALEVYGELNVEEQNQLVSFLSIQKEEHGWDRIHLRIATRRVEEIIIREVHGRRVKTTRHTPDLEEVLLETVIQ